MWTDFAKVSIHDEAYATSKINPFWEKVHSFMLYIYLAFLATFLLEVFSDSPSCIPVNGTNAGELSDAQEDYVSAYCEEFADHDEPNVTVLVLISTLIWLKISSTACLRLFGLKRTLKTYSNAVKVFYKLPEEKRKSSQPEEKRKSSQLEEKRKCSQLFRELLDNPDAKELREIAELLWSYDEHIVRQVMLREFAVLSGIFANAVGTIWWVINAPTKQIFYCDAIIDLSWSTEDVIEFRCIRPWVNERAVTAYIFFAAVSVHVIARTLGLAFILKSYFYARPNPNIPAARGFLMINQIWGHSKAKEKRYFSDFVKKILSKDAANLIEDHIQAVGQANSLVAMILRPKTLAEDSDSLNAPLLIDTDTSQEEYEPSFYKLLHNNGKPLWQWIAHFLKRKKLSIDDILDGADDGLQKITKENEPDEFGNTLLYYVLKWTEGEHFCVRTAEEVLRHCDTLTYDGLKMSAYEFLQDQFYNEPNFPETLRNHLLSVMERKKAPLVASSSIS